MNTMASSSSSIISVISPFLSAGVAKIEKYLFCRVKRMHIYNLKHIYQNLQGIPCWQVWTVQLQRLHVTTGTLFLRFATLEPGLKQYYTHILVTFFEMLEHTNSRTVLDQIISGLSSSA